MLSSERAVNSLAPFAPAERTDQAVAWTLPAELTVVVPTLNERDNVGLLVDRLEKALAGIAWEVVFVDDDSRDGTAEAVRALARHRANVRCLQRIGRRGLASACVEGILSSAAPYIAVIDGDLQHDESILPAMFEALRSEQVDIVIGSRFAAGGDFRSMSKLRVRISRFANRLAGSVVKAELTDPMSGFFMLKRPTFDAAVRGLSAQGYKILVDIFASSAKPLVFKELAYEFRERRHGESKLDILVAFEYLQLLLDKLIGHIVPVRFVLFGAIGVLGLVAHLAVLIVSLNFLRLGFPLSQAIATITAMTSNFYLNNVFTYRDQRLRGWKLLSGLLSFYAVCSIGAVANVGIASYVFNSDRSWWLAGLTGAVVGAVWNYTISSVFTWRARK